MNFNYFIVLALFGALIAGTVLGILLPKRSHVKWVCMLIISILLVVSFFSAVRSIILGGEVLAALIYAFMNLLYALGFSFFIFIGITVGRKVNHRINQSTAKTGVPK